MPIPSAFEFATTARIIFGDGCSTSLAALVREHGSRAVVCTGANPHRLAHLLATIDVPAAFVQVAGEPTVDLVRAATAAARQHRADVILSVGGGSVIDVGKAVAVLVTNDADPLDYLEVVGRGQPITRPGLAHIAVPTTAGTGAEVTRNAVLASPEHRRKISLRSPHLLPRVAVVDPALTTQCPPQVTAAAGIDALTQCLEALVSTTANPITETLAREGLRRGANALGRAFHDGSDLAARSDMALCGLLSGLALANSGLGAVHGFAGTIGGLLRAPHGLVCAALLAPVVAQNLAAMRRRDPANPAITRYGEAAAALSSHARTPPPGELARLLDDLVASLGLPGLGALGMKPGHVEPVVRDSASASSMRTNPIALTREEMQRALRKATVDPASRDSLS